MIRRPLALVGLSALALSAVGLLTLHSVGLAVPCRGALWIRQLGWLALGAVAAVLAARADLRRLSGRPALLLQGGIILATIAAAASDDNERASRWVHAGSFRVQPSELAKLGLVLALASCFRRPPTRGGARTVRDLAGPAAVVACTVIPVLVQPDLGTALILVLVAASMLALEPLSRGARALGAASIAALPAFVAWGMRPYQQARLLAFVHETDPAGANYQSSHALRVAGAGGLLGRGAGSFASAEPFPLPEAHGDFALSVWAHEHGLAGTLLVLGLLLSVVIGALAVAGRARAEDWFGARVAVGVGAVFFWQATFNAGMALGLLPVVGVPLPLVSYGGSSALTCLVGLGLLASVARAHSATTLPH